MKATYWLSLIIFLPLTSHSMSLQEALQTTFEKNPKTQANSLRLQAMEERSKAAWASLYPRLNFSANLSQSRSSTEVDNVTTTSRSSQFSTNVYMSASLYDGKARYYEAKATESNLKSMEANYNSTNSFIPNTKGSLSELVLNSYTIINLQLMILEMQNMKMSFLQKAIALETDPNKKTLYSNSIQQLQTSIKDFQFNLEKAREDFKYIVTVPATGTLDDFDGMIESLEIPKTKEEALSIAHQKNPELIDKTYSIEAAEYAAKATNARLFSPRVDMFYSWSPAGQHRSAGSSPVESSGHTLGLSFSWSFDAGARHHSRSVDLQKEVAIKEKESALQDLEYNIKSLYPSLVNSDELIQQYTHNIQDAIDALKRIEAELDQGHAVSHDDVSANLGMYEMTWWPLVEQKQKVIRMKFKIQKTIGTLFEFTEGRVQKLKNSASR